MSNIPDKTKLKKYKLKSHDLHRSDGLTEEVNYDEVKAIILSGNYFVTLATQLDEVKNKLSNKRKNKNETERLEMLIKQLLYLQLNYKVKTKKKT